MPDNPAEYEAAMVRVLGALCPNWKLEHYNREAQRLRAPKDAVIADKDNYIANLERQLKDKERQLKDKERQLKDKRRREDEEEGHRGYGGAKRARRGYDVRDRNYETYDY
jgi:Skp family chaperone for outer membrane proteins